MKVDQFGQPITGGNEFVTKKQFEAQEQINEDTWVPESMSNGINFIKPNTVTTDFISKVQTPMYQDWFLLLQECQYYSNLYDIDTQELEVKKMWKTLTWTLFFYGRAAVQKIGDKYMVYCLTGEIDRDGTGYPIKSSGILSSLAMQSQMKDDELKKIKETDASTIKLEGDDVIFFKYNMLEYSCWITIAPFIKELQTLLTMGRTASYMLAKKLKYVENNEDGTLEELNAIFTPWLPYVKVKGVNPIKNNGALINNTIEEIKVGSGNTQDITDYIDWFQNYWYSKLGRRTNVNEKQERNINSEVMTSQNNFDVLENELRDWLEIGLIQMRDKWNLDVELTFIQSTKEADEEVDDNSVGGIDEK